MKCGKRSMAGLNKIKALTGSRKKPVSARNILEALLIQACFDVADDRFFHVPLLGTFFVNMVGGEFKLVNFLADQNICKNLADMTEGDSLPEITKNVMDRILYHFEAVMEPN